MAKTLLITIIAALSIVNAQANLGDTMQQVENAFPPLPHDSNVDVVGKDGLLHSTDDLWHYYRIRDVYVLGHIYDRNGISVATSYCAWKRDLTKAEADNFLLTNGFSFEAKYWKQLPDLDIYTVWISRDHRYRVTMRWRDIEHKEGLCEICLWTEQAYEIVTSRID